MSEGGLTSRRRKVVVALATLLGMLITARAGFWQLDRAAQKLSLQAQMQTQDRLPALDMALLARGAEDLPAQLMRRVQLHGRWLPGSQWFLDNRQMQGRPGFLVLTPLQLTDGRLLLVQRGWVPRDAADRSRVPQLNDLDTEVELLARVVSWPSRLAQLGAEAPGPIRQNLDHALLERELGRALLPYTVQQLHRASAADDGLLRDWPPIGLDVGKHYGYAGQWFLFCAMMAGLYVWFQLLSPRRTRRVA